MLGSQDQSLDGLERQAGVTSPCQQEAASLMNHTGEKRFLRYTASNLSVIVPDEIARQPKLGWIIAGKRLAEFGIVQGQCLSYIL